MAVRHNHQHLQQQEVKMKYFILFLLTFNVYQFAGNLEMAIIDCNTEAVEQELKNISLNADAKARLLNLAQEVIDDRNLKKILYFIPHLIGCYWSAPIAILGPFCIAIPFMEEVNNHRLYKSNSEPTPFGIKLTAGLLYASIVTGCGVAAFKFVYNHYKKTDQLFKNALAIKQMIYKVNPGDSKKLQ